MGEAKRHIGWLDVLTGDTVLRTYPLVQGSLRIGRGPDNDLVLPEETVSGHHAVIECADGPRVADLGSRNGTWVNGVRVESTRPLQNGDKVGIGSAILLRVRFENAELSQPAAWLWDVGSGRCHALPAAGGLLGELLADPQIQQAGPFKLVLHADGALLHGPEALTPIRFGEPFQVAGRDLELVDRFRALASTVTSASEVGWQLLVDLNGATGPEAKVLGPGARLRGTIRAGNRVTLLHMLAEGLNANPDGPPDERGWCEDSTIMQGVWGRRWAEKAPSSLQVLVHRVRRDLAELGLAGDVIQKRAGWTRIRPGTVQAPLPKEG